MAYAQSHYVTTDEIMTIFEPSYDASWRWDESWLVIADYRGTSQFWYCPEWWDRYPTEPSAPVEPVRELELA